MHHTINTVKEDLLIQSEFNFNETVYEVATLWRKLKDMLYVSDMYHFTFRPKLIADHCLIEEGEIDYEESKRAFHAVHNVQIHVRVSAIGRIIFRSVKLPEPMLLKTLVRHWKQVSVMARAVLSRVEVPDTEKISLYEFKSWIEQVIQVIEERKKIVWRIGNQLLPAAKADTSRQLADKTELKRPLSMKLIEKYELQKPYVDYNQIPNLADLVDEIKSINKLACTENGLDAVQKMYSVKLIDRDTLKRPEQQPAKNPGFIYERDLNTESQAHQMAVNLDCIFDDDEEF